MENNFNMTNLLSSLLRCFVLQYDINYDKVRLVGGIPQKLPILKTLFEHYTGKEVVIDNNAGTLQGMVKMIDKHLGK
jgi:mannose/fructose/N-acetylgalactosamine-specific phosphotransferase system component IID